MASAREAGVVVVAKPMHSDWSPEAIKAAVQRATQDLDRPLDWQPQHTLPVARLYAVIAGGGSSRRGAPLFVLGVQDQQGETRQFAAQPVSTRF